MLVVVHGAEINDLRITKRQSSRRAAGGQQQLGVGVGGALIVNDSFVPRVQGSRRPTKMGAHVLAIGLPPDAFQGLTLPKRFGQRRTIVRRVRLGTDEADRALAIHLADSRDGRRGGHPAADDQIGVMWHCLLARSSRISEIWNMSPFSFLFRAEPLCR